MNKDLGISADRLRLRRRHLLHRLFHLRGAVQPAAGAVRRAQMDRAHHAELGHLSGCMAFVHAAPPELHTLCCRVLLGAAEAGFFPGIIFYLTLWFPAVYRARIVGYFMAAIPLSTVIGAPVSGLLSSARRRWAWRAGSGCSSSRRCRRHPLAFVVFFYLTDRPGRRHVARARRARPGWPTGWTHERRQREAVRQFTVAQALIEPARAGAEPRLFRRGRDQLRPQLLPAADRQGVRPLEPADRADLAPPPMSSALIGMVLVGPPLRPPRSSAGATRIPAVRRGGRHRGLDRARRSRR